MPNVTLRPVAADDQDRLLAWRNSPAVAPYMYSDHAITAQEHAAWFARLPGLTTAIYWIIELDGHPVGLANVVDIDRRNRRCAWAYYLADPAVRGLGIGSFVEYWVIEHVFGPLDLDKLWCEVLEGNTDVWQRHMAFGFQREALYRDHVIKGGQALNVVGLGLLRADWADLREGFRAKLLAKGFAVGEA
ncbi:UDP-4-amino-4,6-dideoxy-N-acetyl-beta-L-altrosamine N-acetyltransferase [Caulobacter hibisci]|uniref:UDP-4-amino-4, 6-dideoxy-N-acetyl-beta-L-altrosamine N-acetyltransferase n=1 Tax=Caulobacter hibisci TaxID=2035993 RepID=A0ABS0T2C0_9CAUL|nr:UDP-4-amino-4,6-dideoxy-N-acetyl-beta-L-altrosamine N-acetyltransferase [Caulobacter hibisci]